MYLNVLQSFRGQKEKLIIFVKEVAKEEGVMDGIAVHIAQPSFFFFFFIVIVMMIFWLGLILGVCVLAI